jgi:hypothetical protein
MGYDSALTVYKAVIFIIAYGMICCSQARAQARAGAAIVARSGRRPGQGATKVGRPGRRPGRALLNTVMHDIIILSACRYDMN